MHIVAILDCLVRMHTLSTDCHVYAVDNTPNKCYTHPHAPPVLTYMLLLYPLTCSSYTHPPMPTQDTFFEQHGVKLGFMSAFIKASVDALKRVPAVNAVIEGDEIVYRDFYDVSIAVATPKGLVVPVLRDADKLNFAEVEKVGGYLGRGCCGVV